MKRTLIFLFALTMGLSAYAQDSCKILSEQFTENDLAQVADRLGVSADYACKLASEGIRVSHRPNRDLSQLTDLRTLRPAFGDVEWISEENFNEESFNMLNYQFELKDKEIQQFRVGNTSTVVTVLSRIRMDAVYKQK